MYSENQAYNLRTRLWSGMVPRNVFFSEFTFIPLDFFNMLHLTTGLRKQALDWTSWILNIDREISDQNERDKKREEKYI
jgi:hypothetical protein